MAKRIILKIIFRVSLGIFIFLNTNSSKSFALDCKGQDCFSVPNTLKTEDLKLKGISTLRYWGFKVYTAALYLKGEEDPLNNSTKSFSLKYHRDFTIEDFKKSGKEVALKNPEVDFTNSDVNNGFLEMDKLYKDVKEGDTYTITYEPDKGTSLYLNDVLLGTVKGKEFAKAYFSIWLSKDYSLSSSFTEELLGL